MTKESDILSSKRGKNRLKSKGDMLVTRAFKLSDLLYKQAMNSGKAIDIQRAFEAYIQILPYSKPKLTAIAPAQLDLDGNLTLTAEQTREYHQAYIEGIKLIEEDDYAITGTEEREDQDKGGALQE